MTFEPWQWGFLASAAMLVGLSKTGVPGIGILVVPMLAAVFGGRASIGILLPMLILADLFAVAWYHSHAQWDKLISLVPWVVIGMALGTATLWLVGEVASGKDALNPIIGGIVLLLLGLYLAQQRLGERITPTSVIGISSTGAFAGFATTVSNAAGPIMSIYMAAHKLPKEQFMGTVAWYFLIFNIVKLPIYALLTVMNPHKPILSVASLSVVLIASPLIVAGALAGKWLLPHIPQRTFTSVVLTLAAGSAIKLIAG